MAKGIKKTGLWDGLEPAEQDHTPAVTPTRTPTITHTPTYTPAHSRVAKVREPKSERLQMVVRPSTKARLTRYAENHDTSISEVVQRLLDDLLDNAGY